MKSEVLHRTFDLLALAAPDDNNRKAARYSITKASCVLRLESQG